MSTERSSLDRAVSMFKTLSASSTSSTSLADDNLLFFVNGKREIISSSSIDTRMTLLQYLRQSGRTGTKLGCAEGGCGACTVAVGRFDVKTGETEYIAVNACLAPLISVHMCHVVTVEGIGDTKTGLHPIQERIARAHGSQCGFCTPGIVMGLYAKLRSDAAPTVSSLSSCLDGNLCRCTGYRPIIDAIRSFAKDLRTRPEFEESKKNSRNGLVVTDSWSNAARLSSLTPEVSERIRKNQAFPDELKTLLRSRNGSRSIRVVSRNGAAWAQPNTLGELLDLKSQHGTQARIVVGNTEIGIELHLNKRKKIPLLVSLADVPEMQELRFEDLDGEKTPGILHVGGAVTLSRLERFLKKSRDEDVMPRPDQRRGLDAIQDMLRWFASTQIRNVAGLASNIVNASPISDLCPVLMAIGASLIVIGGKKRFRRVIPIDRNFFVGYRRVSLEPDEVVLAVRIPLTKRHEYVMAYKQARRREDDIAIVNGAFRVLLEPRGESGWYVKECAMSFGGMAATTIRAEKTESSLIGARFDAKTFGEGTALYGRLVNELKLPEPVPGGQREFRMTLCVSMLYKFFVHTVESLRLDSSSMTSVPSLESRERSARFALLHEHVTSGTQCYGKDTASGGLQTTKGRVMHQSVGNESTPRAPVGEPRMHCAARSQVAGSAQYCDDLSRPQGLLHACLVLSTIARGKILSIDTREAMTMPGVCAFYCARDMPKDTDQNTIGPVFHDEEVFASSDVYTAGQTVGIIVAETREQAKRGADAVAVKYQELPSILTIDEAISARSFFEEKHSIVDGDVDDAIKRAHVVVQGEMRVGGQEHFYLESNATLAIPGEDEEMIVWASTQAAYKTQLTVAHVLGVPNNKIVCKVKRMGGGFGGKETRSVFVSCAAAFAAKRLNRPVSIMLDRDQDFRATGQRHAFMGKYRAAASKDGKLLALDVDVFSNGGWSADLSMAVMDRALFHADNSYKFETLRCRGYICKTNSQSNTAFRGFGGPQGMAITEAAMEHLGTALRMSPDTLRKRNLYRNGSDVTHYGQRLRFCYMRRMWDEIEKETNLSSRIAEIRAFNKSHRWRKRGVAIVPTKFGISFTAKFMNQAGALVHVYAADGSVLVSHGGTEMGQGLHTKMCQIAAKALGVCMSKVRVTETATDKVPNASPTAASASSDIYGMAVLDACEQIARRLEPVRKRLGSDATFAQVVSAAYFDRVNLSAQGFYKTPDIGYDFESKTARSNAERGTPFRYFTCGVACSEVEIDVLTGDLQVRQADVVMDLGKSLNPAIDIGQVEGGWTQGFGLFTMEEMVWGDREHEWLKRGRMFTVGPSTYKIPSFNDAPVKFNVRLLNDTPNPRAVHSSKAVGEPPLFLAFSVWCAARRAILAARKDAGMKSEHVELQSPLTSERIRMACGDSFTRAGVLNDVVGKSEYRPKGSW